MRDGGSGSDSAPDSPPDSTGEVPSLVMARTTADRILTDADRERLLKTAAEDERAGRLVHCADRAELLAVLEQARRGDR